jgi:hypothetical protein
MDRKQSWNDLLTPVREDELEDLYQNVIGSNSKEIRTEEKPFFLRAAEIRSAEQGISAEQLLATYSERLRNSSYPTPECLTTEEVQALVLGKLDEDRIQHVQNCDGCRSLLRAVEPSPEVVLDLLEEVRVIAAWVSGRTRAVAAGSTQANVGVKDSNLRAAALFHR